ncbi:MAG: S49 family peptidase [Propionibacteriaceae bacterium]|nr:S49 family peptidase [Propionibacteriaceae bacterium]
MTGTAQLASPIGQAASSGEGPAGAGLDNGAAWGASAVPPGLGEGRAVGAAAAVGADSRSDFGAPPDLYADWKPAAQASQFGGSPEAPVAAGPARTKSGFGHGFGVGAGAGIGFGAVLAIGMVVSSLILGAMMAAAALAADGGGTQQYQVVWGDAAAGVAVRAISVTGTILADASDGTVADGGVYGYEIADQLDALSADDSPGVIMVLNTPGGSVNGSMAIADAVTRYKERTGHKVIAIVEGMSASGGMLSMAGADKIYADHGSIIGSIGVIFGPLEYYDGVVAVDGGILSGGVTTSGGISVEYITSGEGKDFGNPYRKATAAEKAMIGKIVDADYDAFVTRVAVGRSIDEKTIRNTLGAQVFSAQDAVKNGLIDAELGRDEAFRQAAADLGVDPDDMRVEAPAAANLISQLLFGASARVPGQAPPLASSDGLSLAASVCGKSPKNIVFYGNLSGLCD